MAFYNLPVFNAKCNWWYPGNTPSGGPADISAIFTQLYLNSKSIVISPYGWNIVVRLSSADAFAIGIPFVGGIWNWQDVFLQDWYWVVIGWEYTHASFPNEYVTMFVRQCTNTGSVPDTTR
jgi:hypothetical protein